MSKATNNKKQKQPQQRLPSCLENRIGDELRTEDGASWHNNKVQLADINLLLPNGQDRQKGA